ncbi:hypothetical protein ACLOJK_007607, partial [Asimina triloba]
MLPASSALDFCKSSSPVMVGEGRRCLAMGGTGRRCHGGNMDMAVDRRRFRLELAASCRCGSHHRRRGWIGLPSSAVQIRHGHGPIHRPLCPPLSARSHHAMVVRSAQISPRLTGRRWVLGQPWLPLVGPRSAFMLAVASCSPAAHRPVPWMGKMGAGVGLIWGRWSTEFRCSGGAL